MPYNKFSLPEVQETFNLTITEKVDLCSGVPEIHVSDYLRETLKFNVPLALAINTESDSILISQMPC